MPVTVAGRGAITPAGRSSLMILRVGDPLGGGSRWNEDNRRLTQRLAVAGVPVTGVIVLWDWGLLEVAGAVVGVRRKGDRFAMRGAEQRTVRLNHPAQGREEQQEKRYQASRSPVLQDPS